MFSFTEKTIKITIYLRQGVFLHGGNTVVIENLPMDVSIVKSGGQELNKAEVVVQNMKIDTIKSLTMLAFRKLQSLNNIIKIECGIKGRKLDTVFQGEITSAVPVANNDGSMTFKIESMTGYYPNQLPTPPVSVQGEVTIEKLMQQFAEEAGYDFENKGVNGSVSNCVFAGSPIMKAKTLANQVGVDLLIDDRKFILQPFEFTQTGLIPLLSDLSGLIGYPSFTNDGVQCKALFNVSFVLGGFFELKSILPMSSGVWKISRLEHKLSTNHSTGSNWFSNITGVWAKKV